MIVCILPLEVTVAVRTVIVIIRTENAVVAATTAYIIFIILNEHRKMRKKNMIALKCSTIMYASILTYTLQNYCVHSNTNGGL